MRTARSHVHRDTNSMVLLIKCVGQVVSGLTVLSLCHAKVSLLIDLCSLFVSLCLVRPRDGTVLTRVLVYFYLNIDLNNFFDQKGDNFQYSNPRFL